ncbi:MAG: PhoU domain-containing protein [Candidatus Omnitrophica bacterium]|nr:PhoU domain-containing protein [Candidatus Omnitrophota bacterium]
MEENFLKIYEKIVDMANIALEMWHDTHKAFMEHNRTIVNKVLDNENKVNLLEKDITFDLINLAKLLDESGKAKLIVYTDIVEDLELIADYCKDILERIEIKIEENLLFSEDAVFEYNQFYEKTTQYLKNIVDALSKKTYNLDLDFDLTTDVESLRQSHKTRLLNGKCNPLASNMFLNIVDFTFAVFEHTKRIALNLTKLK